MKLTKPQIIKYGKTWTKTKKAILEREPYLSKDDLEAERQELLTLAGSKPDANGRRSVKTLSNAQFSTFLDLCGTTVNGEKNQHRRSQSIIYVIEQLGLSDDYLNRICRDQFQCTDWRTLPVTKLALFVITAKNRARTKAKS